MFNSLIIVGIPVLIVFLVSYIHKDGSVKDVILLFEGSGFGVALGHRHKLSRMLQLQCGGQAT
jgi:hypothetical protein